MTLSTPLDVICCYTATAHIYFHVWPKGLPGCEGSQKMCWVIINRQQRLQDGHLHRQPYHTPCAVQDPTSPIQAELLHSACVASSASGIALLTYTNRAGITLFGPMFVAALRLASRADRHLAIILQVRLEPLPVPQSNGAQETPELLLLVTERFTLKIQGAE